MMAALAGIVHDRQAAAGHEHHHTYDNLHLRPPRYLRSPPAGVLLRSPCGALMFFSCSKSVSIRCGSSRSGLKCATLPELFGQVAVLCCLFVRRITRWTPLA
jgi:hypothetical protein